MAFRYWVALAAPLVSLCSLLIKKQEVSESAREVHFHTTCFTLTFTHFPLANPPPPSVLFQPG